MIKQIDETALENLMQRCEDAMTNLELALENHNIEGAKASLSRAETFRDALESITPPQDLKKGADFIGLKDRLDDATVNGSFKIDEMDGFSDRCYNSRNAYGVFGGAAVHEDVHVDDFDFPGAAPAA